MIWVLGWAVVVTVGLVELRRIRRLQACTECGGRELVLTGRGASNDVCAEATRSYLAKTWMTYRCGACGASLVQAHGRRMVSEPVWRAGGGRDEIPTAKARVREEG